MKLTKIWQRSAGMVAVLAVAMMAAPASASLIGDSVTGTTNGTIFNITPTPAVVTDPGVEFGITHIGSGNRIFDVDLDDSTIAFDVLSSIGNIFGLAPVTISDLDWIDDPTGHIIGFTFVTDITGMNALRLSFTDHSFSVDFDGLDAQTGESLVITLETVHGVTPNNNAVPEPITATLGLMGLGVLGMATRRRVA